MKDWFEDRVDDLKGMKILHMSWDKEKAYVELETGEVVYARLENREAINQMREKCRKRIDPEVFRKYLNTKD